MSRILIADDNNQNLYLLETLLNGYGYEVDSAVNGAEAIRLAHENPPDLIITDILMPVMDGYELCRQWREDEKLKYIPFVFYTATYTKPKDKHLAYSLGVDRFIIKPQYPEVLIKVVREILGNNLKEINESSEKPLGEEMEVLRQYNKVLFSKLEKKMIDLQREINIREQAEIELKRAYKEIEHLKEKAEAENIILREEIATEHKLDKIIGESPVLKSALSRIKQVAPTDSTVLILGETGTGKGLFARAVHDLSTRKQCPFIVVNCAAFTPNLIENELFGHEKGAFTGADTRQLGRFEIANHGSILLDEIGELPVELQSKLLRVIQDREFERLGSSTLIKVDIRIITSTIRNLLEDVKNKRFREDLFYRLNVFPITAPPLRQRTGDIKLLSRYFTDIYAKKIGKIFTSISNETMETLEKHKWPGNIRELEHVIERAVITSVGPVLYLSEKLDSLLVIQAKLEPFQSLEETERTYILKILEQTTWRIEGEDGAAIILDLRPSTLRSRMKKLKIFRSKSTSSL